MGPYTLMHQAFKYSLSDKECLVAIIGGLVVLGVLGFAWWLFNMKWPNL